MRIRPFKNCDADTIISWIKDERIFRFWCADRFESYPITGKDLIAQYADLSFNNDIFHFVAYDETGLLGHFNIRYPDRSDINTVRLGYVIVDDTKRGQGLGTRMIKMALDYAVEYMHATKVTIGVFDNNPSALHCYLKAGFKDTGETDIYSCLGEDWTCKELEYDPYDTSPDEEGFTYFISEDEYMDFRKSAGWAEFPLEEAHEGLKNSYIFCLRNEGKPIALGRVLWDHGYVVYIADVIVLPEYQGQGLGRKIMEKIMKTIESWLKPGYRIMVSLVSAKGKEAFYEKFGFISRPDSDHGNGMSQWLSAEGTQNEVCCHAD